MTKKPLALSPQQWVVRRAWRLLRAFPEVSPADALAAAREDWQWLRRPLSQPPAPLLRVNP